jgi:hypothetical protein
MATAFERGCALMDSILLDLATYDRNVPRAVHDVASIVVVHHLRKLQQHPTTQQLVVRQGAMPILRLPREHKVWLQRLAHSLARCIPNFHVMLVQPRRSSPIMPIYRALPSIQGSVDVLRGFAPVEDDFRTHDDQRNDSRKREYQFMLAMLKALLVRLLYTEPRLQQLPPRLRQLPLIQGIVLDEFHPMFDVNIP